VTAYRYVVCLVSSNSTLALPVCICCRARSKLILAARSESRAALSASASSCNARSASETFCTAPLVVGLRLQRLNGASVETPDSKVYDTPSCAV
jgi:hypothetical protein